MLSLYNPSLMFVTFSWCHPTFIYISGENKVTEGQLEYNTPKDNKNQCADL